MGASTKPHSGSPTAPHERPAQGASHASGSGAVALRLTGAAQIVRGEWQRMLEPNDALLLAWLALEGATPRAQLRALLFPDAETNTAHNNLRQRLFKMRKKLGADIVVGEAVLQLAPGVAVDVDGEGDLLAGVDAGDLDDLAEWLRLQRARHGAKRTDSLAAAAEQAEAAGQLASALEHAQALVRLKPESEHAHRRVMRLHYLRGDRAAALAAYESCRQALTQLLSASPSQETEALRQTIARSSTAAAAGAATPRPLPVTLMRPPRMIGRDRELHALLDCMQRHEHALVVGEAGAGKTRLLEEFMRGRDDSVQVHCRPGDSSLPHALVARLARALLARGVVPTTACRTELARAVPELGTAPAGEFNPLAFERAVELLLEAASPVRIIVCDDLHFADTGSVRVLARVITGSKLPCVAFGTRPADGPDLAQLHEILGAGHGVRKIELEPLGQREVAALIESLDLPALDGEALAAALVRHTGGNPQFVLETVRLLLQGDNPGAGIANLPMPAGAGALIEDRLRKLSPLALQLARVAALAGSAFSPELAARIVEQPVIALADAWKELEASSILVGAAFAHDIVFEATRRSVPAAIARSLHARIADLLEPGAEDAYRIAEHRLAAGQDAAALVWLLRAAQNIEQRWRKDDALRLLDLIAQTQDRLNDSAGLFLTRLRAARLAMDASSREQALARIDALDAAAADDLQRCQALVVRAQLLSRDTEFRECLAVAQRALALAESCGSPEEQSAARLVIAGVLGAEGDVQAVEAVMRPMQDWVQRHAPRPLRTAYLIRLAFALNESERVQEALALWQELYDAELAEGRTADHLFICGNLAISHHWLGRTDQGAAIMRGTFDVAVEQQLQGATEYDLRLRLGVFERAIGHYADALEHLRRANAHAGISVTQVGSTLIQLGLLFAQLGRFDLAAQSIERFRTLDLEVKWDAALAAALAAEIDPSPEKFRRACDVARRATDQSKAMRTRLIRLDVEARFAQGDEAIAAVREGAELSGRIGFRGAQLAFETHLADRLLMAGRHDEAQASAEFAWRLSRDTIPLAMYCAQPAAAIHRVFAANGDSRATDALRTGVEWVRKTAAQHVPPEYRDSFLNRNPVNRALLTAATRLPPAATS